MKQLKLTLEQLSVQSFATKLEDPKRMHTVKGMGPYNTEEGACPEVTQGC